jgi:hypothetical protein
VKLKLITLAIAFAFFLLLSHEAVSAQEPYPVTIEDQTPTQPLAHPTASDFQPRYMSSFGQDDAFTVFFEDRDNSGRISFNQTTTGPLGFSAASTATNIVDTHFVVKDWPVVISGTTYDYRGWGSDGNNSQHNFYVSNNLITWTHVSTFTIANSAAFTTAQGFVYYGFHDVIPLNNTYYAFGESNGGQTMIVSSTTGTDDWIAFAGVGGIDPADGPLQMPGSPTPTGNFLPLTQDRGYGKLHVRGDDGGFYLAVNTAAQPSLSPAALEAAFIDPANWTWHDGSTGLASAMIYTATAEHDLRELWAVPSSDPDADWTVIYDADYGAADGGKALGYMGVIPARPVDHFTIQPVDSQISTHPFSLTITAHDAYGHQVPYTGTVELRDSTGALSPTASLAFDATGALTQTVVISASAADVVITATHPTTPNIAGQSNAFEVQALRVTNLDTGERFWTIQEAIDDANTQSGHTISATAGIYYENLTLHKAVRLVGAGSDPAGTVISQTLAGAGDSKIGVVQIVTSGLSTAEPLLLQNLRIEPDHLAGISVGRFTEATGEEIAHLKLDNVKVIGTNTNPSSEQERGLYVDTTSSLRHLVVENSAFENLTYGWYFHTQVSTDTSTVQYITVTNTSFSHNNLKGIYAEKLSDATFATCTVTGNGFSADGVPSYFLPWMAGIDINLKAGDYQNLTFRDCTVTDNALGGAAHGVGLAIKARDDGATYGAHPATLTHVRIDGGLYSGNERGIRLGEPDKANAGPLDVAIHHATFISNTATYTGTDGSAAGDLINYAQASVDATFNDWGVSDLAAIEARIYHQAEDAGLGRAIYYTLDLAGDPTTLMLDGVSTGEVTATIDGLLTPAGHTISFTTQLGYLSQITGTTDASGRVTLVYTPTAEGDAIITATAGMAGEYPRHATTTLTILPLSTLHHFRVYLMQDQVAGVGFPVAISARDAADKVLTAFNGCAWLTDTTGTLSPPGPITFQDGVWNDLVTVTQAIAADLITVTAQLDAQTTGQSIPFAVTHGPAVSAALAPAAATLTAGQSITYTVTAQDAFGNLWDATAEARFASPPAAGGTWHAARYTSQYAGVWPITATVDGIAATATLTVARGPATTLAITPDPATITAGERVTYTVAAEDGAGNTWDVTDAATFTSPLRAGGRWDANAYTTQRPGAWTITAEASDLDASATLHVITATVAALRLHPADAAITAGQRLTYTLWATDTAGNTWDATSGAYFTIDSPARGNWQGNTYTSEMAGTWRVTALYGGQVITGALTVTPGSVTDLMLTPQEERIAAGESLLYTVMAQDAFGNSWDATADATFAIALEAGGTWSGRQYTGEIAGAWTVTATIGATQATAALTITPGPAVSAALAPAAATLTAGQSITYTVTAQDAFGNLWDATAEARFASPPAAGGTWHAARYTSQYAGVWPITATVDGIAATATLTVARGPATTLAITPDPATITAGERVTYTVAAEDGAGNTWDVTDAATFTSPLRAGGRWDANAYTTQRPGAWTITAEASDLDASATLHVITATVAALRLHPADAAITAGESLTFTLWATDTAGNTWDATSGAYFTIDSPARGSWQGSAYTSEMAGTWRVTALYGGQVITGALTVTPGSVTDLMLTPQEERIAAGESLLYTVMAQDAFGNSWDATADATFAIALEAGGTWSGRQYTGEIAGAWTVTATVSAAHATAALTVTHGPAASISLTPPSAAITAGERLTYTVIAADIHGNAWDVTADASYTINPGAGGAWDANGYTAEIAGAWTVTATYEGQTNTAALTVTPGDCVCEPDAYEPDDEPSQAKPVSIGNRQSRNFCDDAVDWIAFTAQTGDVYTITTSSWGRRTDTFLALFDTDGQTQLRANDDYAGAIEHSSRIVWEAQTNGVYYIRVANQAQLTGCDTEYEIWIEREAQQESPIQTIYLPLVAHNHSAVRSTNQAVAPDALSAAMAPMSVISHTCRDNHEIDDTWQQANPIESGVVQTRTFDSDPVNYAADKDFVYFNLSEGQIITVTVTPTDGLETMMMLHDGLGSALDVTGAKLRSCGRRRRAMGAIT